VVKRLERAVGRPVDRAPVGVVAGDPGRFGLDRAIAGRKPGERVRQVGKDPGREPAEQSRAERGRFPSATTLIGRL
jgi:hypothetical protein